MTLESLREVDEDITHRALLLARGGDTRRIDHYQYHAWPDHRVPHTTRPLRALARLLVSFSAWDCRKRSDSSSREAA